MKRIVIRASKLAALVGRNKYESSDKALAELWKDHFYDQYCAARATIAHNSHVDIRTRREVECSVVKQLKHSIEETIKEDDVHKCNEKVAAIVKKAETIIESDHLQDLSTQSESRKTVASCLLKETVVQSSSLADVVQTLQKKEHLVDKLINEKVTVEECTEPLIAKALENAHTVAERKVILEETASGLRELKKNVEKRNLDIDDAKKIIESNVNKGKGILNEQKAINLTENIVQETIHSRNAKIYSKNLPVINAFFEVILCGKVDGIVDDHTIMEQKNRRNRLFNTRV